MKKTRMHHLAWILVLAILLSNGCKEREQFPTVEVYPEEISSISPLLFGQFMERARPEETGPDASLNPDNTLTSDVVSILKEMNIPVIRYYGGYLVEWGQEDWRDLVDNIPGRPATRKEGPCLGYDEYLQLAESIGAQSVIPVHFRKAVLKQMPLEEAVELAAGLVAYINAPVGSSLVPGMVDWPSVRAKNGREKPYGIKYFQIGNEWPTFTKRARNDLGFTSTKEVVDWFKTCIIAYSSRMKEVDPSIKIIVDAITWSDLDKEIFEPLMADEELRDHVDFLRVHMYRPWTLNHFMLGTDTVKVTQLTPEQKWYAGVSVPDIDSAGFSTFDIPGLQWADKYNWPMTMTEWNWNGFSSKDSLLESRFMKGIGAAGFLHALFRNSGKIHLANQSMLVGTNWELNSIRIYPGTGKPALIFPTGQVTAFYSRNHGPGLLRSATSNIPVIEQPVTAGSIGPKDKFALVDVVATGNKDSVFVHAINRHFNEAITLDIVLNDFGKKSFQGKLLSLEGTLTNSDDERMAWINEYPVIVKSNKIRVTLPARSVNVIRLGTD